MMELAYLSGKQDESGRLASVNKSHPRNTIRLEPTNITAVNERRINSSSHSSRVKNLITSRSAGLARPQESMPSTYVEYSRERYEPHYEESYSVSRNKIDSKCFYTVLIRLYNFCYCNCFSIALYIKAYGSKVYKIDLKNNRSIVRICYNSILKF